MQGKEVELEEIKKEIKELKEAISRLNCLLDRTSTKQIENSTQNCISIGNDGVQTDKQTNRQSTIEILSQIKEDLKVRFKNLTKQEFKVFSAIYLLQEEGSVNYDTLAKKLCLTESSIRDYIMRLERKKIPLLKEKINNKKVILRIKDDLKEFLSLDAVLKIRENYI